MKKNIVIDSPNGWKRKTRINDEFKSFSEDYVKLNPGVDATYPTQLYLMGRFDMGITLQKWDPGNSKFHPEKIDVELGNETGSSSSMSGGGTPLTLDTKQLK